MQETMIACTTEKQQKLTMVLIIFVHDLLTVSHYWRRSYWLPLIHWLKK